GESVMAGQVLVELDPTITEAERDHLRADLVSAQLDAARLTAALRGETDPAAGFHPPAEATSAQLLLQKQFLIQQVEEHRSRPSGLDRQAAQKQAELATIAASQKKLEAILDVVQQRVEIRKVLYDHATGSKVNYLEILQAQV